MSDPVQQIKERLDIVDIVGQYVKLTRAGKNYKGLSPFRKEKTPSFYVSPDKGMYYDFSSGQGGDIFTFVQAMEGLDFRGALEMLAGRAGVTLTKETPAVRNARERLYDVVEAGCAFYETKLSESAESLAYLERRGVEPATIRSFRLGFAPDEWTALYEHLKQAGYSDEEQERAGLIKRGDTGRRYDRFRSRIMFPIADPAGRIVAFSGRVVGAAAEDSKNAKYLNSPETPLFDKGRILYGYDKAKQHIRRYDFSILVEGQMDLVMSHQAGYTNTVAVSGTGLTDHHLGLLARLSPRLVMAFDADAAGIASSGRAAALAITRAMDVKVAHLKDGEDPADCILRSKDAWKKAVAQAVHIIEFYLDILESEARTQGTDRRKFLLQVRDTVLPFVARIPSGVDQAHFVRLISDRVGLGEDAIYQDVRVLKQQHERTGAHSAPSTEPSAPSEPARTHTRRFLRERELAAFLFWQETLEPRVLEEEHLSTRARELGISLEQILSTFARERDQLAFQAELLHDPSLSPHRALETLLSEAAREALLEEREDVRVELHDAELLHDQARVESLLVRFNTISSTIQTIEQNLRS